MVVRILLSAFTETFYCSVPTIQMLMGHCQTQFAFHALHHRAKNHQVFNNCYQLQKHFQIPQRLFIKLEGVCLTGCIIKKTQKSFSPTCKSFIEPNKKDELVFSGSQPNSELYFQMHLNLSSFMISNLCALCKTGQPAMFIPAKKLNKGICFMSRFVTGTDNNS